ncbi:MAG TPA: hypothetical protein ENN14_00840 [Chloroflexi bacterium]|nr:hypothetical protein [Chloroflexota bacterium]
MKIDKRLGEVLLAVWLILSALLSLLSISFTGSGVVLGLLALAAGVLLLLSGARLKFKNSLALLLLGIWLILEGLVMLLALSFSGLGIVRGVLALAAGILLLLKR